MELIVHPDTRPHHITAVHAAITAIDDRWLTLRWRIEGADCLVIPPFAGRGHADGLWQTTCFEMFIRLGQKAYREYNFSPSEQWAAYDLDDYRRGMTMRPMTISPDCALRGTGSMRLFDVALSRADLPGFPWAYSLCAVLHERDETHETKTYWALTHGRERPDFHDLSSFTATITGPELI